MQRLPSWLSENSTETGLPRNTLRPDTPLAEVFPDQRWAAWRRQRHVLAAPDLPRLTVSLPISALAQIVAIALSVLLAACLALSPGALLAAAFASWFLSLALCNRLATHFPSHPLSGEKEKSCCKSAYSPPDRAAYRSTR